MSEPKKTKSLTDWEWTTLVAAWRYFEHRSTISAALFPGDIVERYFTGEYDREACDRIAQQFAKVDHGRRGCWDWIVDEKNGTYESYSTEWCKFLVFCNAWCDGFRKLTVSDGTRTKEMEAFWCEANRRWYPKNEYIRRPHSEVYIPDEYIKENKT